jgi:hypothetical protein
VASFALMLAQMALAASPGVQAPEPAMNPGFVHFYNNEFDEAIAYYEEQVKARPDDPAEYNHLAQSILYREMLRDGALESQLVTGNNPFLRRPKMEITAAEKQRFDGCVNQSLKLSEAALEKNPRDVAALYPLGVAHALRANYLFLVEKAWLDALREATAARRTNEKILSIDANSVDARLLLGLDEYIVAGLPFYLRAVGAMGGFHGDKDAGIRDLELVAKKGVRNRYDAEILLAALYRRERCSDKAIPLLRDLTQRFPRNYLFRFEQVQMFSDTGNKEAALKGLAEVEELRRIGAPGYANLAEEKIRYLRGNLLFWYNDLGLALVDLKQVTQKADELDLNTAVLAWLRLGQVYDLQGDHGDAIEAYRRAAATAPKSQAAAEAKGYILSPYRRKRTTG